MKIKNTLVLLSLSFSLTSWAADFTKKGNTVSFEKVRIEVLSPTMFSVAEGANFRFKQVPVDLGITQRPTNAVTFKVTKEQGAYCIQTNEIAIVYNPSKELLAGGITVNPVSEHLLPVTALNATDTQNLGGVIGALDNCDGTKCYAEQNDITSKWHSRIIPMDGILSRRGYTVLKHTKDVLNQYRKGDAFDELYVMCYGTEYRKAFSDFFSIAGKAAMLPKWSLGLIYSRWKDYTEQDYKELIAQFREHSIPVDAIILDMCWHVDHWYGYKYDTKNFPDMKGFQNWAESARLKVGFNHHSGCIYKDDPKVKEFCRRAGLDYEKSIVPGPSFEPEIRVVEYDTKNERHFKAFYDIYLADMIKDGFDFHWVDGANSIYSAELYYKYLKDETRQRPFVLNRQQDYTLCNHRYPAGFSGDTYATWATMRYTLETTLKGANNGVNWSHDVSGYMPQGADGYLPDGEMFARWVQLGAFSPVLRFHAKKDLFWHPAVQKEGDWDGGSRLPWDWGKTVSASIGKAINMRAQLIPYIYTIMRDAHDTGVPMCRGMYIDYPADNKAYGYDQYMFGSSFLVAPLMYPSGDGQHGTLTRSLWLPDGSWYDYFTNESIKGGREIARISDIHSFPVYVKAGSIIPTAPVSENVSEPMNRLTLTAYTPASPLHTTFDLYEDQGENFDFESGACRRTLIEYDYKADGTQQVTVNAPRGQFKEQVAEREYNVAIVNAPQPSAVSVNGERCTAWTWKDGKLSISAGRFSTLNKVVITIN